MRVFSLTVWEPVLPGAGASLVPVPVPELQSSGDLVQVQPASSRLQTSPAAFLQSFLTSKQATGRQAKAVSNGHSASHCSLCPDLASFTLKVRGSAGVSQPCCNPSSGYGLIVPPPFCLDVPPLGEPWGPLLPGCLPLLGAPYHLSRQKAARAELSPKQHHLSFPCPHKFPPHGLFCQLQPFEGPLGSRREHLSVESQSG